MIINKRKVNGNAFLAIQIHSPGLGFAIDTVSGRRRRRRSPGFGYDWRHGGTGGVIWRVVSARCFESKSTGTVDDDVVVDAMAGAAADAAAAADAGKIDGRLRLRRSSEKCLLTFWKSFQNHVRSNCIYSDDWLNNWTADTDSSFTITQNLARRGTPIVFEVWQKNWKTPE